MPASRLVIFLGQALDATVGELNAYPTIATIQTANLKFLLATACNTDFVYAFFAEMAEVLGWNNLGICRQVAAGGGAANRAAVEPNNQIPANRRCNYAGRWQTRVWSNCSTLAYTYAPLFDLNAGAVEGGYRGWQQTRLRYSLSKVDRELSNIAIGTSENAKKKTKQFDWTMHSLSGHFSDIPCWLVVWNINMMTFHLLGNIGNNHPN
jgi:hypothetical protein